MDMARNAALPRLTARRTVAAPDDDALTARRRAAVRARDPSADGTFVYAVRTTGVYCRPSCAARPARPENLSFHDTPADAEAAGFRACKRCRPDQVAPAAARAATIAAICREIETADAMPSLAALAARAGLSPHHFHRVFKAVTGLTPRTWAAAHRTRRVRDALTTAPSVTDAIYAAGYGSNGRFYAESDDALGMTASAFRKRGAGHAIRYAIGRCSLGRLLVAATDRGLCAILLGDDADALVADLRERFAAATIMAADRDFAATVQAVIAFVDDPRVGLALPLDLRGTAFQQRVWQALRKVAPGTKTTYTALAERIGRPEAVRAVASAVAANPLAVAVPCHRVIRRDGALAGYRWGVERKRALLAREADVQSAVREAPARRAGKGKPQGGKRAKAGR